jgi:hypothetical protein
MGIARIYKVGSPFNGVELPEIDFEQTADTMYFAHIDHAPSKLVRGGHTDWTFSDITFGPTIDAPTGCTGTPTIANTDTENTGNNYFPQPGTYIITAVNDDTGQESRGSNESTATNDLTLKRNYNDVTWDAVTGATRYNIYKAENSQFFGYIGTTDGLTFRDDNIGPALDRAPPQAYNPFPGADDYPSTVTLFEQRSLWARSRNVPHGIWGSRTAQAESMDRSRPLRADDSLALTIVAGRVNSVNQLVSSTSLLALTSDSIFTIDGDGSGGVLSAASAPAARRHLGIGGSRLSPLVVDNVVFFAPSVGSSVRSIGYSFEIDGFKSNDVSIFSPHFFESLEIVSWCYAREPRSLVWAARSDGKLLCFTWEQEQNVWGWTFCETDGDVKSVCSISEDGEDRVYLLVDRMVDGVSKRFVERMASHKWDDVADTCFMDCAISAEFATARATFSGLWHLEGRTDVCGIVDGVAVEDLTVTNGSVTLPEHVGTGSKVSFGIPFQVDIETLPLRIEAKDTGANIGRRQQVGEIVLSLRNTRSVLAGIDDTHLYLVKSRTSEAYGSPDDLMNGDDYVVAAANKAGTEIKAHIRQTAPLPLTLLGVSLDAVVNG